MLGRMSRRRYVQALAAGAAVLPVACAPPGGGTGERAGTAAAPARVTVMFPASATETEDFQPVFDAFAQQHPTIQAEWTPGGTAGYNQAYTDKLTSLVASDEGPDVFKTIGNAFGSFAHSGVYRPLDGYVKRHAAEVKIEDFFAPHVEGSKWQGKLYSLPMTARPRACG